MARHDNPSMASVSPFDVLGSPRTDAIEDSYGRAVALGGRVCSTSAEAERIESPRHLIAAALEHLVHAALASPVLVAAPGARADEESELRGLCRDHAAGSLRLTHRALEAHARDVGYDTGCWLRAAIAVVGLTITEGDPGADDPGAEYAHPTGMLVGAHENLLQAMICSVDDRMGVPEHLHRAMSRTLAVFMLADADPTCT